MGLLNFNDRVIKSRGLLNPNDLIPPEPIPEPANPTLPENPSWIRAICVLSSIEDLADTWPKYFSTLPRIGEMVESAQGNRKSVLNIIHKANETGSPFIVVELGSKKYTDVTPMSGGGSNADGGYM